MPNIKKVFRHMRHYGIKTTLGIIREKLIVDPKRFSIKKKRTLPKFEYNYTTSTIPAIENKKPLNVMYLIHYFYPEKKGGTERFTLNLAKAMQKCKNTPIVLVLEANAPCSVYTNSFGNILYRYYEYDGISCIAFRHKKAPLGLYYKNVNTDDKDMRAFARHITKKHSIDVVHATYPQPFASFLLECKSVNLPYIVTCTDFCMSCHYSTMVDNNGDFCAGTECQTKCARTCKTYGCRDFKKRHENAKDVLLGASFVTVPSDFVARVLGAEFPTVPFVPVAHGLSEAFAYKERHGKIKKFVYAGTLTALKGVHLLIDAFTAISGDITLDIYGDGDETYVNKLKASADERVRFCGAAPATDMPKIYSDADCVIVPSMWYETYNFVLREAMATGAFVLAADIGAMPEAVDCGKNGYLFSPADKDDLKEKMQMALSFDFDSYKKRTFPVTEDEGDAYFNIYSSVKV